MAEIKADYLNYFRQHGKVALKKRFQQEQIE